MADALIHTIFICCLCFCGGGSEENKLGLSSDKVAGRKGWHSREIKPKEFKGEEGHIALGLGATK
jgi:hypothetical protein